MRPLGEILLNMESLLEEMVDEHDLQWSDIIYLIYGWLSVHRPGAREEYLDGTYPILYYGPDESNDD